MITGAFRPTDVLIAVVSTAGVQVALFLAFFSASPSAVRANLSDDNARPIAVAITPVSAIPSPPHQAGRLPKAWRRHTRNIASAQPRASTKTSGDQTAQPEHALEEGEAPKPDDSVESGAGSPEQQTNPTSDDASPFEDTGESDSDGDNANGLKARAINLYRVELVSWFMSRFDIRGKLPFETLKSLRAVATVSVSPDHTVGGYRLAVESGNPVFDAQVRSTLTKIQESAAPLPPAPPLYPELLGSTLSVSFQCTVRRNCE